MSHIKQIYDTPLQVDTAWSDKKITINQKHRYIKTMQVNINLIEIVEGKERYNVSGYIDLVDYISSYKRDNKPVESLPPDRYSRKTIDIQSVENIAPAVYADLLSWLKSEGQNVQIVD